METKIVNVTSKSIFEESFNNDRDNEFLDKNNLIKKNTDEPIGHDVLAFLMKKYYEEDTKKSIPTNYKTNLINIDHSIYTKHDSAEKKTVAQAQELQCYLANVKRERVMEKPEKKIFHDKKNEKTVFLEQHAIGKKFNNINFREIGNVSSEFINKKYKTHAKFQQNNSVVEQIYFFHGHRTYLDNLNKDHSDKPLSEQILTFRSKKEDGFTSDNLARINFLFQKWQGEHSVKITIPRSLDQNSNIVLQPSGIHAANVIAHNMGQLELYNPLLLQPKHENKSSEDKNKDNNGEFYDEDE